MSVRVSFIIAMKRGSSRMESTVGAGFPSHFMFYRPIEGGIEVIRVLQAKRDIESLYGQTLRSNRCPSVSP